MTAKMYNDGSDKTVANLNNTAVEFTDLIDINLQVEKGDESIDIALTVVFLKLRKCSILRAKFEVYCNKSFAKNFLWKILSLS